MRVSFASDVAREGNNRACKPEIEIGIGPSLIFFKLSAEGEYKVKIF